MTPEQLARVFKPFYTTKPKGLGVGLPLAKRIVERCGGEIQIISSPGCGARVEIFLRATEQEKAA
jgi:signal transduction histidine kinase